jgi:hypothetical protein
MYQELVLLFLLPLISATPYPQRAPRHEKRALTFRTFDEMTIANGPAGNAAAEALAQWSQGIDLTNLAGISASDLNILSVRPSLSHSFKNRRLIYQKKKKQIERLNAENAETEAFVPALDAATGAAATALQCGLIKNKLLKLTGLGIIDNITIAQGTGDVAGAQSNLATVQDDLATNIALDQAAAGTTCQGVEFTGQTP